VLSCAVMALVVLGGAWYAVRAFPLAQAPDAQILDAPGPVELRAKPITPENPIPRRIYAAPVLYPQSALGSGARGLITLRITLNELGRVVEIRRLGVGLTGGNSAAGADAFVKFVDAFGKAAADAVRLWVYDAPADGPIAFNVGLSFTPDSEALLVRHDADGFNTFAPARVVEAAEALRAARDRAETAAAGGRSDGSPCCRSTS